VTGAHPLLDLLLAAAQGHFPPVDGRVTVVPAFEDGLEAIVAFTGHAVVASSLSVGELLDAGADGYGGAMAPDVQRVVAGPTGWVGVHDVTLAGVGLGDAGPVPLLPAREDRSSHPRVALALDLRRDVRVHGDDRGVVTVARGLAGRTELSLELEPDQQGRGGGAGLLRDALRLVPEAAPVFAAVSPGNARSLRMFLRHGFVPIASEVTIRPRRVSTNQDAARGVNQR
jgi:GNAT superfamily N-acetyltransferase